MGEHMKCDICGADISDWDAVELNTGRSKKTMCPKCYKEAQRNVALYQSDRKTKYLKEKHRKNES